MTLKAEYLRALAKPLTDTADEIDRLYSQIAEHLARITNLELQLSTRPAGNTDETDSLKAQVANLTQEIVKLKVEITSSIARVVTLQEQLKTATDTIAARDAEIVKLKSPTLPPVVIPTGKPTASSVRVNPVDIKDGKATLSTTVKTDVSGKFHLQMVVYDAAKKSVGGVFWENVDIAAGVPLNFEGPVTSLPAGSHTVSVGIFTTSWNNLLWTDNAGSLTVKPYTITTAPVAPWANFKKPDLLVSDVEVPPGAREVHIKLALSLPPQQTTYLRVANVSNIEGGHINVGWGDGWLPKPNDFIVWRPGDDLEHWLTLPIPQVLPEGRFYGVALDRTGGGFAHDGGQGVRVTFKAGAVNQLPATLPKHRLPKTIDLTSAKAQAVADPATMEWSDTGYKSNAASGEGVWQARLPHGYTQPGNGENGIYANKDKFPLSVDPQSKGVDLQGRAYVRLHTQRLPTPLPDPKQTNSPLYPYQASMITALTMPQFCTRRGVFRAQLVNPDRDFAWSAFWLIGRNNKGWHMWPPEVDILENFNKVYDPAWNNTLWTSSAIHYGYFSSNNRMGASGITVRHETGFAPKNYAKEIHDWACLIEDDYIYIFIDGVETACFPNLLDDPNGGTDFTFFPLLNVAVKAPDNNRPYSDGSGDLLIYGVQTYAANSGYKVSDYTVPKPYPNNKIGENPTF